jgi:hypothetical protein
VPKKNRVWIEARDYAQQYGKPIPTMEQIENAERSAIGHTDYGSTWAYGVVCLSENAIRYGPRN